MVRQARASKLCYRFMRLRREGSIRFPGYGFMRRDRLLRDRDQAKGNSRAGTHVPIRDGCCRVCSLTTSAVNVGQHH